MTDEKLEKNKQEFQNFLAGRKSAGKGELVEIPTIDVKAIRASLEMSQSEFASHFWFTVHSIRNWEQGHRIPEPGTRAYLTVIKNDPVAVINALHNEVLEFKTNETGGSPSADIIEFPPMRPNPVDENQLVREKDALSARSTFSSETIDEDGSGLVPFGEIHTKRGRNIVLCDPQRLDLYMYVGEEASSITLGSNRFELKPVVKFGLHLIVDLEPGEAAEYMSLHQSTENPAEIE